MSFDLSRITFDPWMDYAEVAMEQGRVQTDADWNEWLAELSRRIRAGTLDIMGHAVYPQTTPNAFLINASSSGSSNSIRIGLGRMYVDGILVENHGPQATATWDPALAELSNTPQPQPTTPQTLNATNSIDFSAQPYNKGATVPAGPGAYVAYLDVWQRPITYIEDSSLIDAAIGVDTTGRVQTAWRVGLLPLPAVAVAGRVTSGTFNPGDTVTQANTGATGVVIGPVPAAGPMILGQLNGTADATDTWSNTSGAVFTPTAAPAATGSYIAGSVASGTFASGETVVQSGTGASAVLSQAVPSAGPMIVGAVAGTPAATAPWTGQTSGAVFDPVSLPAASSNSIMGAVTSGTFVPGEQVVQNTSDATANVIASVPAAGPMLVGAISGTPDATDTWVGKSSGAVFTPTGAPVPSSWSCSSSDYSLPWPSSAGTLSTQPVSTPMTGPCCMTTGSAYTGPENQFYRIEIHTAGGAGGAGATFKWSRENASVQTAVTSISPASNTLGNPASALNVQSLGRDQVLGFSAGNWIEITDESHDNACLPGELYKIDRVELASSSIVLTTQVSSNFTPTSITNNAYTRIIRWDQSGEAYEVVGGKQQSYYNLDGTASSSAPPNGCLGIPIPTNGTPVVLENGIAIAFTLSPSTGSFQPMNYWNFTARTATGSIETLTNAPPQGIAHHYTKLAIVTVSGSGTAGASDCRTPWPPESEGECGCCCTVTVGDGVNSFGQFTSIQQAVSSVKQGGDVSILCGDFYENVLIASKRNVTIHGCGERTRVYSLSLQPGSGTSPQSGGSTAIDVPAVFSIAGSRNIELSSLCVIADTGNIGVLIDHIAETPAGDAQGGVIVDATSNEDITLSELLLSASTMPAIASFAVDVLEICENIVAMQDRASLHPAVYLEGRHVRFERNQVSIASDAGVIARATNLTADANLSANTDRTGVFATNTGALQSAREILAIGGVQVGGPSSDVWIVENQLTGGSRNAITLGNMIYLDANGNDNGTYVGVVVQTDDPCSNGASGSLPGSTGSGNTQTPVAASGAIRDLHILRNKITNFGMCGIGPVGFFDLNSTKEIVSLTNVLIAENILVDTLTRNVLAAAVNASPFGYGAISLPDVQNLIVRDNIISNYGVSPGAEVCGIYVYHGEGIEIGRNRIRESRDLSASRAISYTNYDGRRAGIYIELATPPTLDTSSNAIWTQSLADVYKTDASDAFRYTPPSYAPCTPALRIEDNTVRVAFGLALFAFGTGPFSILGNHFGTGGSVSVNSDEIQGFDFSAPAISSVGTPAAALTVAIVNLGLPIEAFDLLEESFGALYGGSADLASLNGNSLSVTSGTVLFSNNTCQLMAEISRVRGLCSVGILSLDEILFSNNALWINGPERCSYLDAFLLALSVQAVSNRLQEALNSVIFSGYSDGALNVTAHNLSTYCFLSQAKKAQWWIKAPNVVLNYGRCQDALGTQ